MMIFEALKTAFNLNKYFHAWKGLQAFDEVLRAYNINPRSINHRFSAAICSYTKKNLEHMEESLHLSKHGMGIDLNDAIQVSAEFVALCICGQTKYRKIRGHGMDHWIEDTIELVRNDLKNRLHPSTELMANTRLKTMIIAEVANFKLLHPEMAEACGWDDSLWIF